jgi:hypothetical protein
MQTFIFVLLSILYISEVTHDPHDESHAGHEHGQAEGGIVTAPAH